jgi:hypothetical protein
LLTDKGAGYILDMMTKHKLPVKSLNLADNQISSKTAIKLSDLLSAVDHEVSVDLSLNKLISRKGVSAVLATDVPLEFRSFFIIKKDKNAAAEEGERGSVVLDAAPAAAAADAAEDEEEAEAPAKEEEAPAAEAETPAAEAETPAVEAETPAAEPTEELAEF